jgi:peptide/nickel transport system substrate-binding protein
LDAQAVNDRNSRVFTANVYETLLTRTADGELVSGLATGYEAIVPNVAPLVIAVGTEPSTLDAQAVNDRNSRVFTANVYETLLTRTADGELVLGLASSYEAFDEDTWRFTLRDGVSFHDGSAFDADSAAYSINRMLDEDYETQRSSYIKNIVGAEAVDSSTVDIHTNGVNAVLPMQVAQLPMVPNGAGAELNELPVGTGPYMFDSWDRGQSITAVVNPNYWGLAPSIQAFEIRVIPDSQTQLSALQAGEVDLILDILPEQTELAPAFKSVAATEFSFVHLDTRKENLSDPRVRIAMNMAIDKELMAETLYGGFARPNQAQHLSETMLGYNPDVKMFPYDPEGAKALLAEAGHADGFPLTIHVGVGRYLRSEESAEYIAQALTEIGLPTTVKLWEWNEFRSASRVKAPEPEAMDMAYKWNSNEWFDAARMTSFATIGGKSNKLWNEDVTALFEAGAKTLDQEERHRLYQDAWALIHENPHAIYLLQQDLIYGMSERLDWDPRLDDEYLISDMSIDFTTTYRFTLRDGVSFHDGSAFDADSAAYSINRMLDEDYETQRSSYIKNIVGAEAVDSSTVDIHTNGVNAVLPMQVAQLPMVPNGAGAELNELPVGTGPYMFDSWDRGQSITAVVNPNYWGLAPSIQAFEIRVIPDSQTQLSALQAGEVDLILDILPEQTELAPAFKSVAATEFSFVHLDTRKENLSDPRVRIAMNMAIDKELMAETLYGGFARPNQAQHLSETMLGYNPDVKMFPYDPEGAKALLAEAGHADGFPLTIHVGVGRYLRSEESAEYIAQALTEIGLPTTVKLWEWNEFRSASRVKAPEPEAMDMAYKWNSNEWFDAARMTSFATIGGKSNKLWDPDVTALFEAGAETSDQEERHRLYQDAWALIHENPHAIYLLQQDLIYGMSERLDWDPRLDDEYLISGMSLLS